MNELRELAFRLRREASQLPNKFSANAELFRVLVEAAEFVEASAFDPGIYDTVEIFDNCTVEVWRNSHTGQVSDGWWPNDHPPAGAKKEDGE